MVHASMASMGEASQRHWYTRSYVYEGIWQLTLKKMEAGSCSLWLPASAWALVYQHLDDATRRALLSLCQTTRDAVLQEASGISLKVTDEANLNLQPFARLLARASRLSAAGLALSIQGTCSISSLLISALNGSTWEAVQHLELKGLHSHPDTPVKLVAATFPNLRSLVLQRTHLSYSNLSYLSACTQLSQLKLVNTHDASTESSSTAPDTPSPLTGLRSLTDLTIISSAATAWLVAGATQLARLSMDISHCYTAAALFTFLQDLTQLQSLELSHVAIDISDHHYVSWQVVQRVTATFSQLTSLTLHCHLEQGPFYLLLSSATQLTSLTCRSLNIFTDRSQHSCSWKELKLMEQYLDLVVLKHLPLHSLSRLVFLDAQFPTPAPQLSYSLSRGTHLRWSASELRAALANLARCPAWQASGPMVQIRLRCKWQNAWPAGDLEHALAATSPAACKEVHLVLQLFETDFDGAAVQALDRALGASLKQLTLETCDLDSTFWAALANSLAGLQVLELGEGVAKRGDVVSFCTRRAGGPVRVRFGKVELSAAGVGEPSKQQP